MIVINPSILTATDLVSSNIAELDHAAYSAATTYNSGDLVTYENKNYEAVASGFSGVTPGTDASRWIDRGATNRWSPFDTKVGTQVENSLSITYSLKPTGIINSLSFLNVEANSITVTVTDDAEGVIYSRTEDMADIGVEDWDSYFFLGYEIKDSLVLLDLPTYAGVTIDISIDSEATAKCGLIIFGQQQVIGESEYGLSTGITDYSRKQTDEFGVVDVIERGYSSDANIPIELDTNKAAKVQKFLAKLRATPALYIGAESLPSSYVYGFYRDFSIVIGTALKSTCNLEIEGLI